MRKNSSKQLKFDFNRLQVVRNMNCDKWHLQYDNGMSLSVDYKAPTYFDSPEAAMSFAEINGLKVHDEK
jgi:hypothetical protein